MHSFRRIQAEGWWGQRTTTSSNLKPICLPNGWNCKHSRINFNHMLIFKSNYLKCITFWSCGVFFFRLKTGTCDAVWPTSFLLWPGFNSSHRRLGPKWMPWLTSEVLSVEHGKKQPTNTRLATADELWTHRRHAHNTPASSSESGRGTTKTSWVLNSVIKKMPRWHFTDIIAESQMRRLTPHSHIWPLTGQSVASCFPSLSSLRWTHRDETGVDFLS